MKKIFTIAALFSMLFCGCKKEETLPQLPSVVTAVVSNITEESAVTGGKIDYSGTSVVSESGICWSTVPNPTIEHAKIPAGQGSGAYTVTITGLTSGTTYFVRAYAISAAGTVYGDQRSFTTDGQLSLTLPFVERFQGTQFPPQFWYTIDHDGDDEDWYVYSSPFIAANSDSYSGDALDPYNFLVSPKISISGTNPILEWNIGSYHATYCAEHYKVIVSTSKFTDENCESVGDVVFEETLTRAEGATLKNRSVPMNAYIGKDVYIAWVHYDCSDEYSIMLTDIRIGSAEQPAPVSTPLIGALSTGDVSPGSATVTAIVVNEGGVSVVERGFCYGFSPNPTIADAIVEISVTSSTVFTSFSAELSLESDKTYYVRAYAQNAVGVAYSDEQTITTPATVKTTLFFEDFENDPFDNPEWVLIDYDGDGHDWFYYNDGEDMCARSRSWDPNDDALTPENYMVLPPVTIPSDAQSAELGFKVAASNGTYHEESYEVLISLQPVTIDNCRDAQIIKSLETVPKENGGWNFGGRKVDISAFIGETVYIIFVHKDSCDEESILITDIEIASFK